MKILVNVNHPKCLIVIVFFYSFIFLASWYFPFWRCVFSLITSILIWNGWVRQFAKLYGEEGMLTFFIVFVYKNETIIFFFWNHKLLKLLNISQAAKKRKPSIGLCSISHSVKYEKHFHIFLSKPNIWCFCIL